MREPFSRPVIAANIPPGGKRQKIEADGSECQQLAALFGIPEVAALSAEVEVLPELGQIYRVRGTFDASVMQTDVVTLEPVAQHITDSFEVSLMSADVAGFGADETPYAGDASETGPDLFQGGVIDIGAIVREHLALALDPYPRAPGVEFSGYVEDDPAADPSPFAVLSPLKDRH